MRGGVTTLSAALNTATGETTGQIHHRHRAVQSNKFHARIAKEVPADQEAHLICDNASTHKTPRHPATAHRTHQWLITG
ncbi:MULTISPECIES: hypothetical protein [Streptomyces]